jgi:hypothetical protein
VEQIFSGLWDTVNMELGHDFENYPPDDGSYDSLYYNSGSPFITVCYLPQSQAHLKMLINQIGPSSKYGESGAVHGRQVF